jgi:hypothetical protein
MKKRGWAIAAIAVVLAGAGCGGYFLYQYLQWKAAYGVTIDAYSRLYDYRDAGTLLYEPRLKDFETAMDALERLPILSDSAVNEKEELRICADNLRTYRSWGETNSESVRLGIGADLKSPARVEKEASSCIREAVKRGDR